MTQYRCEALSEPGYPDGTPCRNQAVVMGVKGATHAMLCARAAERALEHGWVIVSLPKEAGDECA